MTEFAFDATKYDVNNVNKQYGVVPKGWYTAIIERSEMALTKNGLSEYLKLTLKIISDEYTNKFVYTNLNVKHIDPKVREKSELYLAWICHCIGLTQLKSTEDLHNKPIKILVDIKSSDGYADQNVIVAYEQAEMIEDYKISKGSDDFFGNNDLINKAEDIPF